MSLPRPLFRNQRTALLLGAVLFAAGAWLLYDAYERRGLKTPRILRPVTFW